MISSDRTYKQIGWETLLIAGLLILVFFPFLGENLYSTKGEPREAIVAVSMLRSGNWILPVTFGAEIPYKPPMLAWCMACLGWLNGGVLTEFLSRVPSGLSVLIMVLAGFRLYARHSSVNVAVAMSLITIGFFELFRSGTICRVDMMLTMFVVTALYAFYRQWLRHPEGRWLPSVWGALLMSGGVLTKGPVGMLLPCMVVFVFRLMRGNRFCSVTVSVGLSAILSMVLPALWYVAAYNQGGEEFLRLVMEENLGRFTGRMTYESHENPAWYNLLTMAYGCAPYTILLLMGCLSWLFRGRLVRLMRVRFSLYGLWHRLRTMDPLQLYSMLASVLIFVFYCIPKSKRSVYLLPVYPFVAYFVALYVREALHRIPKTVKAYCWIICAVGLLCSGAVLAIMYFGDQLGLAADSSPRLPALQYLRQEGMRIVPPALCALALLCGALMVRELVKSSARVCFGWTMVYTLVLYGMVTGAVLPAAMNVKSDKELAGWIAGVLPDDAAVYTFRPDPMGMSRYYVLGFYMSDRMHLFDRVKPSEGYLVIGEDDFDAFRVNEGKGLEFERIARSDTKSRESRQNMLVMRFNRATGDSCSGATGADIL